MHLRELPRGAAFALVAPCGRAGLSPQPVALTRLLLPSSVGQVCLSAFGVGCLLASWRPKLRGAVTGCKIRGTSFKASKASCRALTSVFSEVPSLFGFSFPEEQESPGRRFQALGPVGLQSLQLSQEVLQHLFEDALCGDVSGDVQRMHDLGFAPCVDHPNLPGHHYLEGYFHTLPGAEPFPSVNPRCGRDMLKPAASLRLRAFAEGVRRANSEFLARMAADCPEDSVLRRLLEQGRAFADLAVQIHWGEPVGQDDIAWHVDAPNSALHMAVSVHGHRSLKMKLRQPFELEPAIHEELQVPGDVYVGNPAAFEHGLEYPAATWETRTVAFQLRLLVNEAEMRDPDVHQGLGSLAKGIAVQPLRLPGLTQLRRIEAELAEAC
ncbi:DDX47 [Symbiodinium sp. CCMP2456]|nr:DDX47 [Symbiodinium sp. CCMP2456]